jgi:hypothetical protein
VHRAALLAHSLLRTSLAPDGPLRNHVSSLLTLSGQALAEKPQEKRRYEDYFAELMLFSNNVRELRSLLEKPTQACLPSWRT